MKKKVFALVVCVLVLFTCILTACTPSTLPMKRARELYRVYEDGINDTILISNDKIYFQQDILFLDEINNDKRYEVNYDSAVGYQGYIYYVSYSKAYKTIHINKYDVQNRRTNVICSIFSEINKLSTSFVDGVIYLDYYTAVDDLTSRTIECFDLESLEYKKIESGDDCAFDISAVTPTKNRFSADIIRDKNEEYYLITDIVSGETRKIDVPFIENFIDPDILFEFPLHIMKAVISNDTILLLYWIPTYYDSHLVFEYDFENNAIQFKMLEFPAYYYGTCRLYSLK